MTHKTLAYVGIPICLGVLIVGVYVRDADKGLSNFLITLWAFGMLVINAHRDRVNT